MTPLLVEHFFATLALADSFLYAVAADLGPNLRCRNWLETLGCPPLPPRVGVILAWLVGRLEPWDE